MKKSVPTRSGRMFQLPRVAREAVTPASILHRIITAIRGSITSRLAKLMSHRPNLVPAVPKPNAAESKGKPTCLRLITGLRSDTTANMDTPYNHQRPASGHGTQKMQYCARPWQDSRALKLHSIFTFVLDRDLLIYMYSYVDVFLYDCFINI